MRANTCVWGGIYNPIIPVFKRPPKEWKPEIYQRFKSAEVAKGYIRFFEPDVYVETEKGLLEEAGLSALRQEHTMHPQVIALHELLQPERDRKWAELEFGLDIHDVLTHIYETEQRFSLRDKVESVLVGTERGNSLTEAVFGAFPASSPVKHIRQGYVDVYRPETVKATPDTWRRVFLKGAMTPLRVTQHGLNPQRYWHHDPIIYVFDPTRATDLIDLWNLRLEPHPVLPVPITWFGELGDDIYKILQAEHRPVVGNPFGVMHNATIEFGRSIPKAQAETLIRSLKPGLPAGAVSVKYWRNAIWIEHKDDRIQRDQRMKVTAGERRDELTVKEDGGLSATFEQLAPEFAGRFGKSEHRWVNVVNISNYGRRDIATVLPFNTFDRTWPRLGRGGEQIPVGMEGWAIPQHYKGLSQSVSLMNSNEAIVGSLKRLGIKAELSEPGHIARQMLENLGGLWGIHYLADVPTIELLNKMAGGLRRQRNEDDTIEENFGLRTASYKDWIDLISKRRTRRTLPETSLEDLTKCNVIRLGLETDCPHCRATNWSTLTGVDYRISCERCLKPYDFPQAHLKQANRNFSYRVVGPFAMPDYGRGSYSALLTLRVIDKFRSSFGSMTFSTAMNLQAEGIDCEVDFIAWRGEDRLKERQRPPTLIIGEAKSLGKGDLIKPRDLTKLKTLAARLPDAVVVISVLRDHFTRSEQAILKKFVEWGRRVNLHGEPTNPVLLLTSHELMMEHFISATWKELGGTHAKFEGYEHTRNLMNFAGATQQIYLGMKSFHEVRDEYWKKRAAKRQGAKAKAS